MCGGVGRVVLERGGEGGKSTPSLSPLAEMRSPSLLLININMGKIPLTAKKVNMQREALEEYFASK